MGACPSSHSFTTKKGQKFCGNPKEDWVQKYVKNLNAKQKKTSMPMVTKGPVQHSTNISIKPLRGPLS